MLNSAFKTRASSIHLNKFTPGYPQKKIFHWKLLQSVSSKSAGHIVAFDFASHGFLASHSVIKKHLSSVLQLSDKEMNKKSHIPFSYWTKACPVRTLFYPHACSFLSSSNVLSFVELTCQFYFVKRIMHGTQFERSKIRKRCGLNSKIAPLNMGRANNKLVFNNGLRTFSVKYF